MDNEVLQQILSELKVLKQGQAKLEQGQAKLEQGQAKLEKELGEVKQLAETTNHAVAVIEVEHGKKLGLLLDSNVFNESKHTKIYDRYADDIERLDMTTYKHSVRIEKLEKKVN